MMNTEEFKGSCSSAEKALAIAVIATAVQDLTSTKQAGEYMHHHSKKVIEARQREAAEFLAGYGPYKEMQIMWFGLAEIEPPASLAEVRARFNRAELRKHLTRCKS